MSLQVPQIRQDAAHRVFRGATRRKLHVTIVDEELPYPPTSGKRIRTLNLVTRLAQRHHLTYLCHRNVDAEEVRRGTAFFQEQNIETLVVDRPMPRKTGAAV